MMENSYDRQNSQDYYQYNLWQNSKFHSGFHIFYDWNTSSLYGDSEPQSPEPEEPGEPPENIDSKKRRIISKDDLYKDPPKFTSEENTEQVSETKPEPAYSGYDWTQQHWQKAGQELDQQAQGPSRETKLQRRLNAAIAKPVEMSKATIMMQKMGWEGGPLGRTGDGIVDPIAPNATYATSTIGLGHEPKPESGKKPQSKNAQPKKPAKKKVPSEKKKKCKEHFVTNTLLLLVEFAKNDRELEIVFDWKLHNGERKIIHEIVNYISHGEEVTVNFNKRHMELIEEVIAYNNFVLGTHSDGVRPHRQLYLYKEAPEHVFLVTPDDLKDEDDTDKELEEQNEIANDTVQSQESRQQKVEEKMEIEETNPFLRSITRNLKKDSTKEIDKASEEKRDLLDKVKIFFLEFLEQSVYTEFRFLGPFDGDVIDKLLSFVNNVTACIANKESIEEGYGEILQRLEEGSKEFIYEVKEDCNESIVIYKHKKEDVKS